MSATTEPMGAARADATEFAFAPTGSAAIDLLLGVVAEAMTMEPEARRRAIQQAAAKAADMTPGAEVENLLRDMSFWLQRGTISGDIRPWDRFQPRHMAYAERVATMLRKLEGKRA